jgi:4-oxalocrotonate tautomerase
VASRSSWNCIHTRWQESRSGASTHARCPTSAWRSAAEMIHQLTETMVEIEGENLRPVTWVVVEEVKSGDWGIGGNGLTTADVLALRDQAPAAVPG